MYSPSGQRHTLSTEQVRHTYIYIYIYIHRCSLTYTSLSSLVFLSPAALGNRFTCGSEVSMFTTVDLVSFVSFPILN